MPMPRRVLLLMGTETYRARDFLQAAQKMQLEVHIGLNEAHVLEKNNPHLHHLHFTQAALGEAQIAGLHQHTPFDAILAVDDFAVALAASANKHLKRKGNSLESVLASSQKEVFCAVMQSVGAPSPWHTMAALHEDPKAVWRRLPGGACVLKPTFLNASQGVIRADNEDAFCTAFKRLKRLLSKPDIYAKNPQAARHILVEEYLHGQEAALEGLVLHGRFHLLAFLDKPRPLYGPFFQESLFVTPSRHSHAMQALALQGVQQAVEALGVHTGPVHAEVRLQYATVDPINPLHVGRTSSQTILEKDRAIVLELALRSIGGHCARSLRFEGVQGGELQLEELILAQALDDQNFKPPKQHSQASGVMMLPIPQAGIFQAVHHQEKALAVAGVSHLSVDFHRGEPIAPPPEGARYLGFMFAQANSPDRVEHALEQAFSQLRIEISPHGNGPLEKPTRQPPW